MYILPPIHHQPTSNFSFPEVGNYFERCLIGYFSVFFFGGGAGHWKIFTTNLYDHFIYEFSCHNKYFKLFSLYIVLFQTRVEVEIAFKRLLSVNR